MNNAKQIIDNHNKQILTSYTQANDTAAASPNTTQNKKTCNCRQMRTRRKLPTIISHLPTILMYKVKHNLCPRIICDMFLANSHTYNLRQKDFYQPSFNTVTHGKHLIRYLGPKLWSKIPSKDRSAASLKQFKTRIRSLDLSNILDGCSGCYLCNS